MAIHTSRNSDYLLDWVMNIQEKSLALAELMGWKIVEAEHSDLAPRFTDYGEMFNVATLAPYVDSFGGKAQFAAILLEFPKVMMRFAFDEEENHWLGKYSGDLFHGNQNKKTYLMKY